MNRIFTPTGRMTARLLGVVGLAVAATANGAGEQQAGIEAAAEPDLREKTQNPVSDLISLPLQNNFDFGIGPSKATRWVLNVQPVIPFKLTEDWNLITRTIIPIINQGSPAPGVPAVFGLGDLNPTFFISPAKPSSLIWGAGPTFTLPTGTDPALTAGQWAVDRRARDQLAVGIQIHVAPCRQRCALAAVDHDLAAIAGAVQQPETPAAETRAVRFDDRQRGTHRDRSIEGVATGRQHLLTGPGGDLVVAGHGPFGEGAGVIGPGGGGAGATDDDRQSDQGCNGGALD